MSAVRCTWVAGGLALAALSLLAACEVTGVGVEDDVGLGYGGGYYGGGYYEPYGYDYGGWGRGYRVGPDRRGGHGDDRGGGDHHFSGRGGAPAYRPAPAGRAAPSIPGRSRGR